MCTPARDGCLQSVDVQVCISCRSCLFVCACHAETLYAQAAGFCARVLQKLLICVCVYVLAACFSSFQALSPSLCSLPNQAAPPSSGVRADASSTWAEGDVPAVEIDQALIQTPKDTDSFGTARALLAHLKATGVDIDAALPNELRGVLLAFTALLQTKLEPATLFTTWCEQRSFEDYTQV